MIATWVPYRLVKGDIVLAEIEHLEFAREYTGAAWSATVFEYRANGTVSRCYTEFGSFTEARDWVRGMISRKEMAA